MRELHDFRLEIDEIDAQLVSLFERRMAVSKEIGAYKKEHMLDVYDPKREQEILDSRLALLVNSDYKQGLLDFFKLIMEYSRKQQI